MENFGTVRRVATRLRLKIDPGLTTLDASAVVDRAIAECGLFVEELQPDDASLAGALGLLNRKFGAVLVNSAIDPTTRAEVIAHEIGHFSVHRAEGTTVFANFGKPGPGDPVQRVEAYSVKERREAQANVFARELLLPRTLARQLFLDGERARAIAKRLGLRLETVFQQLTDALLLPDPAADEHEDQLPVRPLDKSQDEAANHRGNAFLLEAGPGTGKTRTLVERIARLIKRGEAEPDQILALTFSNRAAGELADRLEEVAGPPAANIWTGTFHAFGLELLRKYHDIFGKGQDPRLIDGSGAINLLEETLPTLPLVHHQNLFEPALALRDILRAISRAKDELVSPDEYEELAIAMEQRATAASDQVAIISAAKAREVALVYRHYQSRLNDIKAVDYGDLVMLPALKLRDDANLCEKLGQRFKWVHVDEYQDVNHACAILVKGIVGEGARLWVVGDPRQSIYRFRGASSRNIARFGVDYPVSSRHRLEVNYRSTSAIVSCFADFGASMRVSSYALPLKLEPDRKESGTSPTCLVTTDPDQEMDNLAGAIRFIEKGGVSLRQQVVLARSNGALAQISEELEARAVPVLYLGPLFSRPEVRDLLSLLSFLVGSGSTLLRVAAFPEYNVDVQDVLAVLAVARAQQRRAIEIVGSLETVGSLSDRGRAGFVSLATHLQSLDAGNTPWLVLMEYLFERSSYVHASLAGHSAADDMRRVAVWQLVEAMRSMPLHGSRSPISRGLDRVRHMVLLADDRELRRLPDELAHLNGVNLLTIHASKGLEFEAVHIPGLRAGAMPVSHRAEPCPAPDGLVQNPAEADAHEAEEECLFFVALSRARTHLRLYRPATKGGRTANPSSFLNRSGMALPPPSAPVAVARQLPPPGDAPILEPAPPTNLSGTDIEAYERCPRRFFYERVAALKGGAPTNRYLAAHGCVLKVIERAHESPTPLDPQCARQAFDEAWASGGLVGHAFEGAYRALAEGLLANLAPVLARGLSGGTQLTVTIHGRTIVLPVDQIDGPPSAPAYRTIRRGRPRAAETDRLANALLLQAVRERHGSAGRVETFNLTNGVTTLVTQTDAKRRHRLANSAEIVGAIERGEYPPAPSDWACPRCRFFFMCPSPTTGA